MRSFLAALMLCVLMLAGLTDADARSRRHAQPDRDAALLALMKRQANDLDQMKKELSALRKMFQPDLALANAVPLPRAVPRNPILRLQDNPPMPDYRKAPAASAVVLGNTHGLKPEFVTKLAALRADMPAGLGFKVGSGFRTHAEQARLHRQKPGLAARPGHSNHERGLAGDLEYTGSKSESSRWVHRYAHKYGLRFPMGYEPWHIEPEGLTRYASHRHRGHRYVAATPRRVEAQAR